MPSIAKDQGDLGRLAKDRIVSIIKAATIALGPTGLEGMKSSKLTTFITAFPEVASQSIIETKKQRAKVISDLEKVMEFLEHKNTFVRVTKVTSKMRKIPMYTETNTGSHPNHQPLSPNYDGSPASSPSTDAAAGTPAAAAPTAGTPVDAAPATGNDDNNADNTEK